MPAQTRARSRGWSRIRGRNFADVSRLGKRLSRLSYVVGTSSPYAVSSESRKPSLIPFFGNIGLWLPVRERRRLWSLLEFKRSDVIIVTGTKEAGINIKVQGTPLVTGGTGSVTVKVQGV